MKLREIYKLAHREYVVYKTRSIATIITIGVLFGLLLGILFVAQGLENVTLRYAREATGGLVYLVSSYGDDNEEDTELVQRRVERYGGTVVVLQEQQNQLWNQAVQDAIIAEFDSLDNAVAYYSKDDAREFGYDAERYQIEELLSNQINVYRYFQDKNHSVIGPVSFVLIAVSVFILAFTMTHLIASSTKTFVLYRAIGASKKQLFSIYFVYLIELCFKAMCFAIVLGLFIGGLATWLGWSYLSEQLVQYYPETAGHPIILIGLDWRCIETILSMYAAAPVSFLLCLDQFSNKKIAQKLKGD